MTDEPRPGDHQRSSGWDEPTCTTRRHWLTGIAVVVLVVIIEMIPQLLPVSRDRAQAMREILLATATGLRRT